MARDRSLEVKMGSWHGQQHKMMEKKCVTCGRKFQVPKYMNAVKECELCKERGKGKSE